MMRPRLMCLTHHSSRPTRAKRSSKRQAASFRGNYWSQDTTRPGKGQFSVLVIDNGEPSAGVGIFDGDGFSIDLKLGPYMNYTRAGNIQGGNIQVE